MTLIHWPQLQPNELSEGNNLGLKRLIDHIIEARASCNDNDIWAQVDYGANREPEYFRYEHRENGNGWIPSNFVHIPDFKITIGEPPRS
jgi:hypothetical protein